MFQFSYELPIIGVIEDGNEDGKINISRNNFSALIDTSKNTIEFLEVVEFIEHDGTLKNNNNNFEASFFK